MKTRDGAADAMTLHDLEESPAPGADPARRPAPAAEASLGRDIALNGLFVLAIFYTLYAASTILLPVVLAILLTLILSPAVRALGRLHLPAPVSAALVVSGLVASLGYGVYLLLDPATEWIEKAPRTLGQVERKIRGIKRSVQEVNKAAEKVEEIASIDGGKRRAAAPAPQPSLASRVLTGSHSVLLSATATVVLLYLLLASGDMFLRKLVRVMPRLSDKKRAVSVAREIQSDMGRYLLTITCINAGLGLVSGVALYLLDMPNPVLWGALVAVLNYLPYIGAAIAVTTVAFVAFLSFDSPAHILGAPAVLLALTTLEGQLLTPVLTGRRLSLNPVVVFLSMLFWAWLWGAVGALMAVPILMTCKILCDHLAPLAPVGEFLGGKNAETAE
ncbi:MAG: AI-2E family transporter [Burkholderiales bacterium]|nr:AI-2E family transporter [Burkholderiales bacterium]